MAVLNVRLDDDDYGKLKELADGEGVSLSEYVRALLLEAVVPVQEQSELQGDQSAPDTFSVRDRVTLSLLHRILARVLPADADGPEGNAAYQLMKAEILEAGYTGQYWWEVAGMETELSKRDCKRVVDILEMFRILTYSIERIERGEKRIDGGLADALRYKGFDHNDSLEGHMARYVRFLMGDGEHWVELIPQVEDADRGNSHMQVLEVYLRMLTEYRRIMDSRKDRSSRDAYFLSKDELQRIADAQVHPSNRHRG